MALKQYGEHLEVTEPFFETIQNRTGDSLEHTEHNRRYYRCIKLFIIKSSVEADATFRALFDISSYGKKNHISCTYWRISGYYIIGGK